MACIGWLVVGGADLGAANFRPSDAAVSEGKAARGTALMLGGVVMSWQRSIAVSCFSFLPQYKRVEILWQIVEKLFHLQTSFNALNKF